jgi:pimeloyl-ACP methyl ester carboxylesterase
LVTGCTAHLGFLAAWNEVQLTVFTTVTALIAANPTYTIVVVGHSLGAGVGTLAAAHLRVAGFDADLYTYGSPRVGNEVLASFITSQTGGTEYRITHFDDPVPRLPPLLLGYRHTSPEYWLDDGNATTTAYGVSDVTVCTGTANITCNGGTTGFDITAHNYYFEPLDGCSSGDLPFRRDTDISDADLEARLNTFAALDYEYATALEGVL